MWHFSVQFGHLFLSFKYQYKITELDKNMNACVYFLSNLWKKCVKILSDILDLLYGPKCFQILCL